MKKENEDSSCVSCEKKGFLERGKEFLRDGKKYEIERTMIKYTITIVCLLVSLQLLGAYIFKIGWVERFAPWIFYAIISVASIGGAIWHMKSYSVKIGTMPGMMIGMTFGMQSGLMIGTILGATNGIFVGGLAGMIAGVFTGAWCGKCCGVMGVMEGMMAGIMGGTMGGMIGVMFFADKILYFMPFFMFLNIIILWGLSYMLYEEVVEAEQRSGKPASFAALITGCVLAVAIVIAVMLLAPRSGMAKSFEEQKAVEQDLGNVQDVTLSWGKFNYQPEVITVKANQPVRLEADTDRLTGCFRAFVIPELKISKTFTEANNVLEFTPTRKGRFTFMCSMGMGKGTLVVE